MEYPFWPQKVYIEPAALDYPAGKELHKLFNDSGTPVQLTPSHNRITGLPRQSRPIDFQAAKKILVIGVRRSKKLQTCRPSAHYQLPLATGCPGMCHYCYLHTNLGKRPYLRLYVNIEEILDIVERNIRERYPEETIFEGAAVCDPLFAEPFTKIVSKAIEFFSTRENAKFRFVTKFDAVESFLNLPHMGRTRFRFSLNHPDVIAKYEKGTSLLDARLKAASRIFRAGYPLGFMIAPIFLEGNWEEDYTKLFKQIKESIDANLKGNGGALQQKDDLTFELITHRFTIRARENIREVFPGTPLLSCMQEENRRFKYGQFGYGKYLYPDDTYKKARAFFRDLVSSFFPEARIDYFI